MPLCVHCAHPAQVLYTTYKTRSNIRLGVCSSCDRFMDPLIEHDPLILLLDLILLRPRVFLHLLYNKDSPPLDATESSTQRRDVTGDRDQRIRGDVMRLSGLVFLAEVVSRTIRHSQILLQEVFTIILTVAVEFSAQQVTTLGLALFVLWLKGWYPRSNTPAKGIKDGRQLEFTPWLIPLTLLYTSLLPLMIHLLLSIWYTPPISPTIRLETPSLLRHLPETRYTEQIKEIGIELILMWNSCDRVWVGTRLLGGMSAGIGLRVLLPTRPWETTGIVLAGWGAAALAAHGLALLQQ